MAFNINFNFSLFLVTWAKWGILLFLCAVLATATSSRGNYCPCLWGDGVGIHVQVRRAPPSWTPPPGYNHHHHGRELLLDVAVASTAHKNRVRGRKSDETTFSSGGISHLLPLPTEESSAWYTAAQMSSDCKNAKLLIKLIFAAPLGTHALLSPQSSGRECRGNTGLTPDTTSMLSQVTRPFLLWARQVEVCWAKSAILV